MKPEIKALLERAADDAEVARVLCERGSHDAAASRAYYAMFHAAEAMLADIGQSYSSHGAVQGAFGREFCKTGHIRKDFHRWLLDAQDLRNLGDYGAMQHVAKEDAEQACERCDIFVREAQRHPSDLASGEAPQASDGS